MCKTMIAMSKNNTTPEEGQELLTLDVTITSASTSSNIARFCKSKGLGFKKRENAMQVFLPAEASRHDEVYGYLDSQKAEYTLPLFRS